MCGDYHSMNKYACLDKYVMPLLKNIFDALQENKMFNILDFHYSYHYLPLRMGDKVKMAFQGFNLNGNDCCLL